MLPADVKFNVFSQISKENCSFASNFYLFTYFFFILTTEVEPLLNTISANLRLIMYSPF